MCYRGVFVVCILSLVFLDAKLASSAPFQITDVTPTGWSVGGVTGVNASGEVAGWGTNPGGSISSFVSSGGTVTDLGKVGFTIESRCLGINDAGTAVGWGIEPTKAWYNTSGGTMTTLPYLSGGTSAEALAIDNAGEIGGYSNGPGYDHATIWKNGVAYDLGAGTTPYWLPTTNTTITALSNNGVAVGDMYPSGPLAFYSTYAISGGVLTSTTTDFYAALGLLYPQTLTAVAVNDNHQIVGSIGNSTTGSSQAYLYTIGGAAVDLPLLGSGTEASAQGVNDSGWVVGWSYTDSADTTKHAFLYHDGEMTDLNNMIDPASGWTLTSAQAVSNSGDIVGTGTIGGQTHAFVLSPHAGDANLDGRVDINDLTIVLTDFGRTGTSWGQGDFNGDARVDVNDLTIVLSNFGATFSAGIQPAPEPSTVATLFAAAICALAFLCRKKGAGTICA